MKFKIEINVDVVNIKKGQLEINLVNKSNELEENKDLLNDKQYNNMSANLMINIANKINGK